MKGHRGEFKFPSWRSGVRANHEVHTRTCTPALTRMPVSAPACPQSPPRSQAEQRHRRRGWGRSE